MDMDSFSMYLNSISRIDAQDRLKAMEVAEYPHLNAKARSERFKKTCKEAGIKKKISSFDDIEKVLG